MITALDLFAGAGGSSTGLQSAGIKVVAAGNHWKTALATHAANHPGTAHFNENLSQVNPRKFPRTTILWGSPSCTHHTRAQGARRTDALGLFDTQPENLQGMINAEPDSARATMWDIPRFAEVHPYEAIIVENVPEVTDWRFFSWWLDMMTSELQYRYTPVVLNAIHANRHGDPVPQTRVGWFGIFTRDPLVIPRRAVGSIPAVGDVLDDSPGPELLSKPRAEATMRRIAATLSRYPHAARWIISYYGASKVGKPVTAPCGTLTTKDRHAVLTDVDGTLHYRMLNNAEQARVQGFPDTYQWHGTGEDITKQIGNSVVPAVARDIGHIVAESLGGAA